MFKAVLQITRAVRRRWVRAKILGTVVVEDPALSVSAPADSLLDLARKLEEAENPALLDAEVWSAFGRKGVPAPITSSIDAAVQIVPLSYSWRVEDMRAFDSMKYQVTSRPAAFVYSPSGRGEKSHARTTAAALCAAVFRVIASQRHHPG